MLLPHDSRWPKIRKAMIRSSVALLSLQFLSMSFLMSNQIGFAQEVDASNKETIQESDEALIERVLPSLATFRVDDRDGKRSGIGSGFVIDASGLIATNFHVIHQGRDFSVEIWPNRKLKILSIEAANREHDLAIVRVDVGDQPLKPLPISEETTKQGKTVLSFGNPLGLQHSVVRGIVSAIREIEGEELIQLAIPIQPGNSGGPLVDRSGKVLGIVNMKSAVDDNLGFAIPVAKLQKLLERPNPIPFPLWIQRNSIDSSRWEALFGARWLERSSVVQVSGMGDSFGGRSLCLWHVKPVDASYQISVRVKLSDESGAAGLVFATDDNARHYGFYPSNGNMRLSCFRGPDVLNWQVMEELPSDKYRKGDWNRLTVSVEPERIRCFINGSLVIESRDRSFRGGKVGLAKFRDTEAQFKAFELGPIHDDTSLKASHKQWLAELSKENSSEQSPDSLEGKDAENLSDALVEQAMELRRKSQALLRLSSDVRLVPILESLANLKREGSDELLKASLLIASLENPDLDHSIYSNKLDSMAKEIEKRSASDADTNTKIEALNKYLFVDNGYRGSSEEYYHLANSLIDRVIDDREGMPITLCVMYIEVGRRLGLDLEGVGLPGHFIVSADGADSGVWLDPFHDGKKLGLRDVTSMVLLGAGRPMEEEDIQPQTTRAIARRILNNMLGSAQRAGNQEAMLRCSEGLVALNPDEPQTRMMRGALLRQTGRLERSNLDLDWLIEHPPQGIDVHDLIQMRKESKSRD